MAETEGRVFAEEVAGNWYEEFIEPGIRGQVRLLRNNGFNTTCSCHHKMYVECDFIEDGELKRLNDLLFNEGYRNYTIIATVQRLNGCLYEFLVIKFGIGLGEG